MQVRVMCVERVADMSLKVTGKELEKESVVHTLAQGVALILMHTLYTFFLSLGCFTCARLSLFMSLLPL